MPDIWIFIDNSERLEFFIPIVSTLKKMGCNVGAVSNRPSIIFRSSSHFNKAHLLKVPQHLPESDLRETITVISGRTSIKTAHLLYASMHEFIQNYLTNEAILICWNGSCSVGKAIKDLKKNMGYKTLFLEISNLEAGLVADSEGVNAMSSLYKNKLEIKKYATNNVIGDKWISRYKKYKKTPPPQVVQQKKIRVWSLLDYILFKLCRCLIIDEERGLFDYLKKKLFIRTNNKLTINQDFPGYGNSYIFTPLQLSSDSQVLLNSDFDNKELIEVSRKAADEKDAYLYIKPHPAENSAEMISYLKDVSNKYSNVYIVQENTSDLIEGALEVFVINSTVGLEALILNTPIQVIGRSFYSWFDFGDVCSYVFEYLIPIDYFTRSGINEVNIEKLLKRAH